MAEGNWTPVFVLPNVDAGEPIGNDVAMLAPARHPSAAAIRREHPSFGSFLSRFTDQFKEKFEPAVLLVRADAPRTFLATDALASFRDLVAISVVAYSRALNLRNGRGHRAVFGNTFAFYPWMPDKNYQYLIGNSPAMVGVHEIKRFRGQSSPELFRMRIDLSDADRPLLVELLRRWYRCYWRESRSRSDVALFRSLNMAYHASLPPEVSSATFYDYGRLVSLWISAFEILAHPGESGEVNLGKVLDVLESIPWQLSRCGEKRFPTRVGKRKTNRTLGSWLYRVLYDCRNDFLHGNQVSREDLLLHGSRQNVLWFAAPLYRLALTRVLPLTLCRGEPSLEDTEACAAYLSERIGFNRYQRTYEEALLRARRRPRPEGLRASSPGSMRRRHTAGESK